MSPRDKTAAVILGIGLLGAGGLAYLASRSVGPIPIKPYTECAPADVFRLNRHSYPSQVAPGLQFALKNGLHNPIQDSVAAAMPAEEAW